MVTSTIVDSRISSITPNKQQIIQNILRIAEEEHQKGNTSITQEKLDNLSKYVLNYQSKIEKVQHNEKANHIEKASVGEVVSKKSSKYSLVPEVPKPKYSPLFHKFNIKRKSSNASVRKVSVPSKITFKSIEKSIVAALETIANILDNLHLFSKFPMFPKFLVKALKQTNKLWVLILVFLIRKTISQLLNVMKKEEKVKVELDILRQSKNISVLGESEDNRSVFKRYEQFIKDLKFDKTMLILELSGNILDLAFNLIELSGVIVPDWFISGLNFASMLMTVYRMNKDDEYVDDNITDDLI